MQPRSQSSWGGSSTTGTWVERKQKIARRVSPRRQLRLHSEVSRHDPRSSCSEALTQSLDFRIPSAPRLMDIFPRDSQAKDTDTVASSEIYQKPSSASPPLPFFPPLVCASTCRSYISAICSNCGHHLRRKTRSEPRSYLLWSGSVIRTLVVPHSAEAREPERDTPLLNLQELVFRPKR